MLSAVPPLPRSLDPPSNTMYSFAFGEASFNHVDWARRSTSEMFSPLIPRLRMVYLLFSVNAEVHCAVPSRPAHRESPGKMI
jgi:hypothetical protein